MISLELIILFGYMLRHLVLQLGLDANKYRLRALLCVLIGPVEWRVQFKPVSLFLHYLHSLLQCEAEEASRGEDLLVPDHQ